MIPRHLLGALALAALAATACGSTTTVVRTPAPTHGVNEHTVELRDADGTVVGNVTLSSVPISTFTPSAGPSPGGSPGAEATPPSVPSEGTAVKLHVVITALAPGSHGFDVHANGRCDPPGFTSAGGIFNPTHRKHGHNNPAGPQAGELGNLPVGDDGKVTLDLINDNLTLDAGRDTSLVGTPAGSALVVHVNPDDEKTDPEGNSGPRIACGVISPSSLPEETPSPETSPSPSATASPEAGAAATPTPRRTPTPTPRRVTPMPTPTPTPATSTLPSCSSLAPIQRHPYPPNPNCTP